MSVKVFQTGIVLGKYECSNDSVNCIFKGEN